MSEITRVHNCTGRVLYCEACGARMEPGNVHECPGYEDKRFGRREATEER